MQEGFTSQGGLTGGNIDCFSETEIDGDEGHTAGIPQSRQLAMRILTGLGVLTVTFEQRDGEGERGRRLFKVV